MTTHTDQITHTAGTRIRPLAVQGCFAFTPHVHRDERGIFVSPLQDEAFTATIGHRFPLAQSNHSRSARGVLRGVHFTTTPPGQAKYVHCAHGHAMDIVVDLRLGSPTYKTFDIVNMDTQSFNSVYIPPGVGHAFLSLEDDTVMSYLVSTPYQPQNEQAIDPFDPTLNLPWPTNIEFKLSPRDRTAPSLTHAHTLDILPTYTNSTTATHTTPGQTR